MLVQVPAGAYFPRPPRRVVHAHVDADQQRHRAAHDHVEPIDAPAPVGAALGAHSRRTIKMPQAAGTGHATTEALPQALTPLHTHHTDVPPA